MTAPLHERRGGENAILAAADLFYDKVLADDLTRPFFEGVAMASQTRKLVSFMTWAFGGPVEYRGKDLRSAHPHLVRDRGLGDAHFDGVATHLKSTLEELGVAPELVAESIDLVATTRGEVLGR